MRGGGERAEVFRVEAGVREGFGESLDVQDSRHEGRKKKRWGR